MIVKAFLLPLLLVLLNIQINYYNRYPLGDYILCPQRLFFLLLKLVTNSRSLELIKRKNLV